MTELDVLLEQLDELMGEPIVDGSDALEVVIVAGLAARLGARPEALASCRNWVQNEGHELVQAGFDEVDLDELVHDIDGLVGAEDNEVDDTFSDFDDVVAAAVWCGKKDWVRCHSQSVARSIRQVPETFCGLATLGSAMAGLASVGQNLDVYEYWLAMAETAQWVS